MKAIRTIILNALLIGQAAFANNQLEGAYKLQLYFGDNKPFLDVLTLEIGEGGKIEGNMHVPNDFDAELKGITTEANLGITKLQFFVELPQKYHKAFGRRLFYELHFLDSSPATIDYDNQFVGFVTHHKTDSGPTYVGSIVGFKKKN